MNFNFNFNSNSYPTSQLSISLFCWFTIWREKDLSSCHPTILHLVNLYNCQNQSKTMPPRLPVRSLPKTVSLSSSTLSSTNFTTRKIIPAAVPRRYLASDHGHEDMYDPPTGWLFGVPPGEKPKKEGWETISYIGIVGVLFGAGVAYAYKPDTSYVLSLGSGKLPIFAPSMFNKFLRNTFSLA